MGKLIIKCKYCKEKMKIQDKKAKYRCPACKKINKIKSFDIKRIKMKNFYDDMNIFLKALVKKVKTKFKRK